MAVIADASDLVAPCPLACGPARAATAGQNRNNGDDDQQFRLSVKANFRRALSRCMWPADSIAICRLPTAWSLKNSGHNVGFKYFTQHRPGSLLIASKWTNLKRCVSCILPWRKPAMNRWVALEVVVLKLLTGVPERPKLPETSTKEATLKPGHTENRTTQLTPDSEKVIFGGSRRFARVRAAIRAEAPLRRKQGRFRQRLYPHSNCWSSSPLLRILAGLLLPALSKAKKRESQDDPVPEQSETT